MSTLQTRSVGAAVRPPRVMIADGTGYEAVPAGNAVVYEVATVEHRQLGVVVEVAVPDPDDGSIRRHECVDSSRVRRLASVSDACARAPVVMAYHASSELRSLLASVTPGHPETWRTVPGGVRHTVWTVPGGMADAIHAALDGLGPLYIADGHHRMAAAERTGRDTVLAALFPADEMLVFGYHRYVAPAAGTSRRAALDAVAARPAVAELLECRSPGAAMPEPGVVGVCTGDRWFRLRLRAPAPDTPVRDSLDVVALDDGVLTPVFGKSDTRAGHGTAPSPGGDVDADRVARWCTDRGVLAFLPHPPEVSHIISVADAGSLLPPKSTWFAPKIDPSLFLPSAA